ncbi:MAG: hypothetical protein QM715_19795 [Nibricoccus sp.]
MKLGSIPDPFSGEKITEIFPKIATFVAPSAQPATPPSDNSAGRRFIFARNAGSVEQINRLGRLNYFPGRHLTDSQLSAEQRVRVQRLLLRGRSVTHGVVSGLEISSRDTSAGIEFQLQPGQALTQFGSDIVVDHVVATRLTDLRLFNLATGKVSEKTIGETGPLTGSVLTAVLVLQPGYAEDADLPLALQNENNGADFTPGGRSPDDEVYYKTTTTDAARLVLYPLPWPVTVPSPLTVPRWQNSAAWTIFEKEAESEPLPWYNIGAPLALIGIDATGALKWIDRHAVVRPAGAPRQRLLFNPALDSRLFNARFNQFCAQLATLTEPASATTLCRQLPPVGLLPKAYLKLVKKTGGAEWAPTQNFFPTNYTVDLSVIPLEQLDALLADTLGLDPYDPARPDAVRLLLPISQQWFDPELLKIEIIDPRFDQNIARYRDTRADWLAKRYDLTNRRRVLELSATGKVTAAPLTYTDADPKRLEDPERRGNPPPIVSAPPDEAVQYSVVRAPSGTTFTYTSQILSNLRANALTVLKQFGTEDQDEFKELFKACGVTAADLAATFGAAVPGWLAGFTAASPNPTGENNLNAKDQEELRRELLAYIKKQTDIQAEEQAKINNATIQELISYLDAKTNEADELVDSGFLKVRTDVFRLGTLLTNNSLGTKFAASPSLANIIERKPAKADVAGVNNYATQLLANFAPSAVQTAVAATNTSTNNKTASSDTSGTTFKLLKVSAPLNQTAFKIPSSDIVNFVNTEKSNFTASKTLLADPEVKKGLSTEVQKAIADLQKSADLVSSADFLETIQQASVIEKFADNFVPNLNLLSQKQIRAIPLDRLQPALAPTVRQEIHDGRLEIFERLTRLNLSLADLTTDFVDVPKLAVRPKILASNVVLTRIRFQTLISRRRFDDFSVIKAAEDGSSTVNDADESKHFSSGVSYADMAMAALRAVEKRIKEYRAFTETLRSALAETQALIARITTDLIPVEVELEESRQDVAVALDLKAEEQARLDAINAHREKVLTDHLKFLVYHRPRAIKLNAEVPSLTIEPSLTSDPVLDCLRDPHSPPTDLATLRELFRSSPARWFKHAPNWIEKVDRWEHLRFLLERSSYATIPIFTEPPIASNGRYSQVLGKIYEVRYASTQKHLAPALAINRALLPTLSWQDLRHTAHQQLTLGHLISAGPAKLAKAAAQELDDIFTVATCLHEDFCKVPALIRLSWAERFGQFDNVSVDFRNISRLPGWPKIDFVLRREMQLLVDWIFNRIDQNQPEALDLINDLIRVAMLLASHAPVNQLITGQTVEPITPIKGNLIKIKVDPAHVHVGMDVIYKNPTGTNTIRATVEDISSSHIAARVIDAPAVPFTLAANSTLHFQSNLR